MLHSENLNTWRITFNKEGKGFQEAHEILCQIFNRDEALGVGSKLCGTFSELSNPFWKEHILNHWWNVYAQLSPF